MRRFAALVVVFACHSEPSRTTTVNLPAPSTAAAPASIAPTMTTPSPPPEAEGYFPDEKSGGLNDFVREWYGKHLRTMGEPSLWEASTREPTRESYRFTWLRTWGHPVAIRFDLDRSGATMRYVELDGAGGYAPGKIIVDRTRHVTAAEWTKVDAALSKASFWSLPPTVNDMGNDGLQWVIEGTRGGRYHLADRWTPSHDTARRGLGDFLAACRAAFDLSGGTGPFE